MAIAGLVFAGPSMAQALPDPTRPPPEFIQESDGASGPTLQSIVIAPNRKFAIINGQMVKEGDKYRDAQVVEIKPGEVVLREGKRREVLKLYAPTGEASKASPGKG